MLTNSVAAIGIRRVGGLRPMFATDAGTRLVGSFDAAMAHRSTETMGALRATATDFVDCLRAQGLPVEQVVGVVETLLRGHRPVGRVPSLEGEEGASPTQDESALDERLIGWCVRAYHDDAWW